MIYSALSVAKYVLQQRGEMTAMKLQKLVYYCQAWSLVWDDAQLFHEPIAAWQNGPCIPVLHAAHKGMFKVSSATIPERLQVPEWYAADIERAPDPSFTQAQLDTMDAVLRDYGDKTAQWLSDLSMSEAPWRDARLNRLSDEIPLEAIRSFYAGLLERARESEPSVVRGSQP